MIELHGVLVDGFDGLDGLDDAPRSAGYGLLLAGMENDGEEERRTRTRKRRRGRKRRMQKHDRETRRSGVGWTQPARANPTQPNPP
jgi:hypothetical protein